MTASLDLPVTGDTAVDDALEALRSAVERPRTDLVAAAAAVAAAHEALRARLSAAG